mmetsp:Transcript_87232/g.282449  ORF Transcript_87232/g.282449 Transcript_87232/m.282449 type:complete len:249 (-) Transcript_87232:1296-2042(-)
MYSAAEFRRAAVEAWSGPASSSLSASPSFSTTQSVLETRSSFAIAVAAEVAVVVTGVPVTVATAVGAGTAGAGAAAGGAACGAAVAGSGGAEAAAGPPCNGGTAGGSSSTMRRCLASRFSGSTCRAACSSRMPACTSPSCSNAAARRSSTFTKSRRRVRSTGGLWPNPVCATPLLVWARTSSRTVSSCSCLRASSCFSRSSRFSFSCSSSLSAYSSAWRMAFALGPSPALFCSIATRTCSRTAYGLRR